MRFRNVALAALMVVAVHASASADTSESGLATALDVFAAVCPLSTDAATQQRAHDKAVAEGMDVDPPTFIHGPPPGTHSSTVIVASFVIDTNVREGPSGLCAVSFDSMSPDVVVAELTRRFGQGQPFAEGRRWTLARQDGDAAIYFRPHVAGQTGPGWIGWGGYLLGLDAAAAKDTVVFYTPEQHGEIDSLRPLGSR